MSKANARVKFPDGTIKYTVYHGTGDCFFATLHDTEEEAWLNYTDYVDTVRNPYDDTYYNVEIADDYGSGSTFLGRASKDHIVGALYDDHMYNLKDGLPDWWVE